MFTELTTSLEWHHSKISESNHPQELPSGFKRLRFGNNPFCSNFHADVLERDVIVLRSASRTMRSVFDVL
jgi:hypothetical protein